jgi:hypothetical protein
MASIPQPQGFPAGESRLHASDWEKQNARRLAWLALALVALGVAWRFSRYLLRFPVWGDEAMLLVNYFTRGWRDLLEGPIDNCQVAPILFHWAQWASVRYLGTDELSLRVVPFLTGLANLALFWRLAHMTLPPLSRTLSLGILSVSIWPVCMGAFTKPYAGDLFFSLVFLTAGVAWLRKPWRRWPMACLAAAAPLAVLGSYPSVFVGGAVSLALLPGVWRRRDRSEMALFVLFNLLLVSTFLAHYYLVGVKHLNSHYHYGKTTTADGMLQYWEEGFPPLNAVRFLGWLFTANMGQMAAYPVGGSRGLSFLTVAFALVGVRHLYRHGQRGVLAVSAGAFALWFLAGLLRKYPYGSSCRVAQHAAPFFCLLAGLGAAALIQRFQDARTRWKATLAFAGLLAVVGVAGITRDIVRPYRDNDALWARELVDDLVARAGDDLILTTQDPVNILPTLYWHLGRRGSQVVFSPDADWKRIGREESSVWILVYGPAQPEDAAQQEKLLGQGRRRWRCVERRPSVTAQRRLDWPFLHCQVFHWVKEDDALAGR